MRRTDYRTKEAAAYRRLYSTAAWRAKRLAQLSAYPLCRWCEASGLVTSAAIVDHVIPHKGDLDIFWNGPVQSLCKLCHDSGKQRQERSGYDSATDIYGYPIDPAHPANASTPDRQ